MGKGEDRRSQHQEVEKGLAHGRTQPALLIPSSAAVRDPRASHRKNLQAGRLVVILISAQMWARRVRADHARIARQDLLYAAVAEPARALGQRIIPVEGVLEIDRDVPVFVPANARPEIGQAIAADTRVDSNPSPRKISKSGNL